MIRFFIPACCSVSTVWVWCIIPLREKQKNVKNLTLVWCIIPLREKQKNVKNLTGLMYNPTEGKTETC